MKLKSLCLFSLYSAALVAADGAQPAAAFAGNQRPLTDHAAHNQVPAKRVAIIGAGSAGTSAAYYLRRYASSSGLRVNITVFERADYIGGRSTTVNAYGDPLEPVELGASIFVKVNRNLVHAVEALNLSVTQPGASRRHRTATADDDDDDAGRAAPQDDAQVLGIWNGRAFVWTQRGGGSWGSWLWDTAKLLWRYGALSPLRAARLRDDVVARFLRLYDAPAFPWARGLRHAVREAALLDAAGAPGSALLAARGVGERFAREVVQALTRVNYAQNVDRIHGVEAMVAIATDGAMAVQGGNWQMFTGMLAASGADVRLGTAVTHVARRGKNVTAGGDAYTLTSRCLGPQADAAADEASDFDAVVLAAPYKYANLTISPPPPRLPSDDVRYVRLHVTLFASPRRLAPAAFNLPPHQAVPDVILTTIPADQDPAALPHSGEGVGPAGFFSISRLRTAVNRRAQPPRTEFLYKIFSPERVEASFLRRILGVEQEEGNVPVLEADREVNVSAGDITWLKRHTWHSYPYLPPIEDFDSQLLDGLSGDESGYTGNLWYPSAIERFISTMETSSLSGMNVARLIVDNWLSVVAV